jgi:flagellar basal-body rod protein FlgG
VATGKPLDLAISGSGFFRVEGPAGPLYTRNGNFRLAPDGRVTTAEGYPVAGRDGGPVRLDAAGPWEINAQGEIRQGGNVVAALALVDFEQPGALAKAGSTYFSWNGDPSQGARAAAGATVEQGRLEGANFSPAESAVRLVSVLRQFEALNRALALGGEMSRRAIEEVARVNP